MGKKKKQRQEVAWVRTAWEITAEAKTQEELVEAGMNLMDALVDLAEEGDIPADQGVRTVLWTLVRRAGGGIGPEVLTGGWVDRARAVKEVGH